MLITITEFAQMRDLDADTVSTFIRRHESIKKDVVKQGRLIALDTSSAGYKELLKQYPLPQPVQVVEDTESRKELIQAQKTIIALQSKLQDATMQIAQAETIKMLLEDKQLQLDKSEIREKEARDELALAKKQITSLQEELQIEKNKTWWQKLRRG